VSPLPDGWHRRPSGLWELYSAGRPVATVGPSRLYGGWRWQIIRGPHGYSGGPVTAMERASAKLHRMQA
jgi:hypothetical protein